MSGSPEQKACAQVEALLEDARPLNAREQDALSRHLASCPRCRALVALVDIMDMETHGPPGPPLDDVARQRLLSQVVETAATRAPRPSAASSRIGPWGRRPLLRRLGLGAALAAALAIAFVLMWRRQGGTQGARQGPGAGAPSPAPRGSLVLVVGEVTLGATEPNTGAAVRVGQVLKTGRGMAAVHLSPGISGLLGEHTTVALRPWRRGAPVLRVLGGTVSVAVRPEADGRAPVVITSPHGRIEVLGTLLHVRVTTGYTEVAVTRGVVRAWHQGRSRHVRHGQILRLGESAPKNLADAARRLLSVRDARLRLLQRASVPPGASRASLAVDSDPRGALVTLDGVSLGWTPMSARVPLGHATLQISSPRHQTITELVDLRAGQHVRRDFHLHRLSPEPAPVTRARPGGPVPEAPMSKGHAKPSPTAGGAPRRLVRARSARVLIQHAQARRMARDWAGAIRAYLALIRRFPRSGSANVARVSIGNLQLDHLGHPAAALRSFDRYLRYHRGGPLAQEAAYGRIRALRALGRRCAELRAIQAFQGQYRGSLHRRRLQARIQVLGARPGMRCPD